ncbi:FAD dependent oxidoreductase protein [Apiospora arundinis]
MAELVNDIVGLAGLFSTCLDVMERIDSSFVLTMGHHANLDDPAILKTVQTILLSITEIVGGPETLSPN